MDRHPRHLNSLRVLAPEVVMAAAGEPAHGDY